MSRHFSCRTVGTQAGAVRIVLSVLAAALLVAVWLVFMTRSDRDAPLESSRPDAGSRDELVTGGTDVVEGYLLSGKVVDERGRPVRSGRILVLDHVEVRRGAGGVPGRSVARTYRGEPGAAFPLDADGRFSARAQGAVVAFQASSPGFAPGFSDLLFSETTEPGEAVIHLRRGATLNGVVRNAKGEPVESAYIHCTPVPDGIEPDRFFTQVVGDYSAETDESGAFRIADLGARCRDLTVFHPEYPPFRSAGPFEVAAPRDVVLEDGQWIEGALEVAGEGEPPREGRLVIGAEIVAISLRAGRFRSACLDASLTQATVQVDGFVAHRLSWEGGPGVHDLGVVPLKRGRGLTVEVTDSEGVPLPGASVEVVESTPAHPVELGMAATDDEGRASVGGLDHAEVRVSVNASGYGEWSDTVALEDEDTILGVSLEVAGRISGRVSSKDGAPLSGVKVRTVAGSRTGTHHGARGPTVTSRHDGSFLLEDVPTRVRLEILFEARDRPPLEMPVEPLRPGESRHLGVVLLKDGERLAGKVTDTEGGPIEGVLVVASPVDSRAGLQVQRWAQSDASGAFLLKGLRRGAYALICSAEGYQPDQGVVDVPSRESPLTFELERGTVLEGVVVDEGGTPVAQAQVAVSRPGTPAWSDAGVSTGSDGRFRHEMAPAGRVHLSVWHPEYRRLSIEKESIDGLPSRIVLEKGATLELALATDGPAASLPLTLQLRLAKDGASWSYGLRQHGGSALVSGLPSGRFRLEVRADGFVPFDDASIELFAGKTTSLDTRLRKTPEAITVRVVDSAGRAVSDATVQLFSLEGRTWRSEVAAQTDGTGISSNIALKQGSALDVHAAGYAPSVVMEPIRGLTGDEILVTLEPESSLSLVVLGSKREPLDNVEVLCQPLTGSSARVLGTPLARYSRTVDGRARMGELSAGSYRVQLSRDGEILGIVETELTNGQEKEVEFALWP